MSNPQTLKETQESLTRLHSFDVQKLARVEDLGRELNFAVAAVPAESLLGVYKRIPVSVLLDLTDEQLNQIKGQAQADYNLLNEILTFSAVRSDATQHRTNLINQVQARRDQVFSVLWQYIAYGVARATDTSILEAQARSTIQSITDRAGELTKKLNEDKVAADAALAAIRAVATEQGVSQQAEYFKSEADQQEKQAASWLSLTYKFAGLLAAVSILSLILHKIPLLTPGSTLEALQLLSSKILIFAVAGFLLIHAARNFGASKHNAVVNRHRQNALLTFRALATAAGDRGTEDIILANAAACIFAPQQTGYAAKLQEGGPGGKSVLELMTKAGPKTAEA